jgi:hypothetical protein
MKCTVVVYGHAHRQLFNRGDEKQSKHVPFQGRCDYHFTACTNETHTNKWVHAHVQLSTPFFLFMKPTLSKAKEFSSVLAFKEVYVCEILISEIERRFSLYDCLLKENSDKGLKEGLWGKVCKALVHF